MGHVRLGKIPKTRQWESVVSLIESGNGGKNQGGKNVTDNVKSIASKTLNAAHDGLENAKNDIGLRYTFYLLTQIVLAARDPDWQKSFESLNIYLSEEATVFELTAEIQNNIDDHLIENFSSTDVSEIAQQVAGEAIFALAHPQQLTLFGNSRDELVTLLKKLSTKKGFSQLGQVFFGRFVARFLNFHICRLTSANMDSDKLSQIGDLTKFNEALEQHCEQSAKIVRDFCGQWYSKTEFQEGINLENTSGFMAVALKKLQAELKQQEADK